MSDHVNCPDCGAKQTDLDDHEWGTQEELTVSCGECGRDYLLSRQVSVSYGAASLRACSACGHSMSRHAGGEGDRCAGEFPSGGTACKVCVG